MPLNAFLNAYGTGSAGLSTRIDNAFAAVDATNARINALNGEISRSLEIGAIAAAMKDAIPNYGDRFAIRLNAAGFGDKVAGAVGFSYNVTDSTRLSVNYGQGRSQSVVSGGLNMSFH